MKKTLNTHTVQVVFTNSAKLYDFKTDLDLKAGDLAVCFVNRKYEVVKVVNVLDYVSTNSTAWIVDSFDNTTFLNREEDVKKAEKLKIEMQKRKAKLDEMKQYEDLATWDDEMSALLAEYKAVNTDEY